MLVLDDNYLVILKPEVRTKTATVVTKVKHKQVIETFIDTKKAPKVLVIVILNDQSPEGFTEKALLFDDWRKCAEIREFFLDEKKQIQLMAEKKTLLTFITSLEQEHL